MRTDVGQGTAVRPQIHGNMRAAHDPLPNSATMKDTELLDSDDRTADVHGGVVKWFDVTRGFGFIVADDPLVGDILLHFSVLHDHGRRSLPEGARVVCETVRRERGIQARAILSIDLTSAVEAPRARASGDRADRLALVDEAGPFERVTVKWFNRLKGYGFLVRESTPGDVFIHMETLRRAGVEEVEPDDSLRARVVEGDKGPLAVVVEKETE